MSIEIKKTEYAKKRSSNKRKVLIYIPVKFYLIRIKHHKQSDRNQNKTINHL